MYGPTARALLHAQLKAFGSDEGRVNRGDLWQSRNPVLKNDTPIGVPDDNGVI
jgi:hypothetical protein